MDAGTLRSDQTLPQHDSDVAHGALYDLGVHRNWSGGCYGVPAVSDTDDEYEFPAEFERDIQDGSRMLGFVCAAVTLVILAVLSVFG